MENNGVKMFTRGRFRIVFDETIPPTKQDTLLLELYHAGGREVELTTLQKRMKMKRQNLHRIKQRLQKREFIKVRSIKTASNPHYGINQYEVYLRVADMERVEKYLRFVNMIT